MLGSEIISRKELFGNDDCVIGSTFLRRSGALWCCGSVGRNNALLDKLRIFLTTQTNAFAGWCACLVLHIGLISVQRLVNDWAFVIDTWKVQIIALDILRRGNLTPIDHRSDILLLAYWLRHVLGNLLIVATVLLRTVLIGRVGMVWLFATILRILLHNVLSILFCGEILFGIAGWHCHHDRLGRDEGPLTVWAYPRRFVCCLWWSVIPEHLVMLGTHLHSFFFVINRDHYLVH